MHRRMLCTVSTNLHEMAVLYILLIAMTIAKVAGHGEEMALANITRFAAGDLFSLTGSDCGPTRCMELTHGTALPAIGTDTGGCVCQCRHDTPAFREDQRNCVNHIDECLMASFGRGATKPQIPFVYLPLKGQIIYPSKEIIFTDVEDAICAVTNAQYLSSSGWVSLRDLVDNDVPFGLYRDEGKTFLQWRGSPALHSRLEGRLVAAHVLCSASTSSRLASSCAAFRIAGASQNALLDVRSIPFNAGEIVTTEAPQTQGLSVLESLAIGVCVLLLIFVYAAGIIFYVNYKQKQKRKDKDPEQTITGTMSSDNGSSLETCIDMSNVMMKTNPLLKFNGMGNDFSSDAGLSDVSEQTEDTLDSSPQNTQKFQKLNTNVISAMVHSRRKKPTRPSIRSGTSPELMNERMQRRSASPDTLERAPISELSIVDCSVENHFSSNRQLPPSNADSNTLRKKLYFNPVFFETEHLKDPPPAAIDFLIKIREVMSVAKERMISKRFIPNLSDIPEEELYHTIDLGWDIPCARRGRRFSAISLKQENSRKSVHCGGCPGCDSNAPQQKAIALTRSNSCKTCVSEDYKQRIVRKWLDEVPLPMVNTRPIKTIAKVNGTPRISDIKLSEKHPMLADSFRNENNKPKITETILKESTQDQITKDICNNNIKTGENIILNEFVLKKKEDLDLKTLKQRDLEIKVIKNIDMELKNNNLKDNDHEISKSNVPSALQEKKSPSSHTSRRIRKKLPPPPPPPVNPPEDTNTEEELPIPPEVKVKMEAVIQELNNCRRVDSIEVEEMKIEKIDPIAPKIVIPVLAADSQYFSDDSNLADSRKKDIFTNNDSIEFDSLERSILKRRRFSVACTPEIFQRNDMGQNQSPLSTKQRLTSSWLDVNRAVDDTHSSVNKNRSEVFIKTGEHIYNNVDEMINPGPLTIQVRGSPIENRRNENKEEFDPDTLDRRDTKKRVEKILLKSAGSFKHKSTPSETEPLKKSPVVITRKIGNLRQIYEAKAKAQEEDIKFYNRRGSITFGQDMSAYMQSIKTPDLIRHIEGANDPKPPIPPKQRRSSDVSPKFSNPNRESPPGDRRRGSEERDRFPPYARTDLNARRSGRRSARTRSRRTDLKRLYRTEDSGYMSTDSNESKRRAKYLMQIKPVKAIIPEAFNIPSHRSVIKTQVTQIESDTDDLESLCDGRSESGGESVETDSVFFGNFDDTKELFAELGLNAFEPQTKISHCQEQIDSGFMGETNIILSGDSDSEHRSVISIRTGHDGRTSAASLSKLDEAPYLHTIECRD